MWRLQFDLIDVFTNKYKNWQNDAKRILQIKYEDLINKTDINKRYKVILNVINHLYINIKNSFVIPKGDNIYQILNYKELLNRIKCAFDYKNKKTSLYHRKKDNNNNKNDTSYVTMEYAYKSIGKDKICNIWNFIKDVCKY